MKKLVSISIIILQILNCNAQLDSMYFGQTPPGDTAVLFAPGIISLPTRFEGNLVFYPDSNEIYFDAWVTTDTVYKILYTKKVNNKWTEQVALPFKDNINAGTPFLSADGKKLYFERNNDIWTIERTASGWSDPKLLPSPVNTPSAEYCYSESDDGVGYVTSDRPGGKGIHDIWKINSFPNDSFQVENAGSVINSNSEEYMSCIAHDGSFLIYNTFRYTNYSDQDLWISFRKDNNEWTIPVGMELNGAKINLKNFNQHSPTLTPDGKYLFFCRENNTFDQRDVYWIRTSRIIPALKKIAFAPKFKRPISNISIKVDSTFDYTIPENTFSCEYGTASLKYSATLNDGSALPAWLSFNPTTRTLSGTPSHEETDTIRITVTNADTVSASCKFNIVVSSATAVNQYEERNIQVFPNPTTGQISILFSSIPVQSAVVKIFDLQKKQILTKTFQNTSTGNIDLTGYPTGIYLVKVDAGNESYNEKIIKN